MPELPDVTVYVEALQRLAGGRPIRSIRLVSPFLLRTAQPPLASAVGRTVQGFRRIGKRIVWELEGGLFLVVHLMVAGRFHWKKKGANITPKTGLVSFDFDHGSLFLTEASSKKRASLHVVEGEAGLAAFRMGGVEPLDCTPAELETALRRENHTLKRALTDPSIVSGVGNAYSDEILHRAKLSPILLTGKVTTDEAKRLHGAMRKVLEEWIGRLRRQADDGFPEKVTAFHEEMAVHGQFGKPCPVCGSPVQRIVRAENETNYCPTCQTGGKLLADRALSRLLGEDWPRSLDEMERMRETRRAA